MGLAVIDAAVVGDGERGGVRDVVVYDRVAVVDGSAQGRDLIAVDRDAVERPASKLLGRDARSGERVRLEHLDGVLEIDALIDLDDPAQCIVNRGAEVLGLARINGEAGLKVGISVERAALVEAGTRLVSGQVNVLARQDIGALDIPVNKPVAGISLRLRARNTIRAQNLLRVLLGCAIDNLSAVTSHVSNLVGPGLIRRELRLEGGIGVNAVIGDVDVLLGDVVGQLGAGLLDPGLLAVSTDLVPALELVAVVGGGSGAGVLVGAEHLNILVGGRAHHSVPIGFIPHGIGVISVRHELGFKSGVCVQISGFCDVIFRNISS